MAIFSAPGTSEEEGRVPSKRKPCLTMTTSLSWLRSSWVTVSDVVETEEGQEHAKGDAKEEGSAQ